ncbi:MAG: 2-hydroxyacyl-CoA dehydratase family protein [Candidatus Lokiarchaeia archaeon]
MSSDILLDIIEKNKIKETLENEVGIPTIFLEFDVTVPIGQFKTRVEAFLEILREEDLF